MKQHRKERLTVTVDLALVQAGQDAVAAGRAESVSAWVNLALAERAAPVELGAVAIADALHLFRDVRAQRGVVASSGPLFLAGYQGRGPEAGLERAGSVRDLRFAAQVARHFQRMHGARVVAGAQVGLRREQVGARIVRPQAHRLVRQVVRAVRVGRGRNGPSQRLEILRFRRVDRKEQRMRASGIAPFEQARLRSEQARILREVAQRRVQRAPGGFRITPLARAVCHLHGMGNAQAQ